MKSELFRLTAIALISLFGGATAAYANCPPEDGEFEEEEYPGCADYISSGANDDPLTGYLVGGQTVTEGTSAGAGATGSIGIKGVANAGGSITGTATVTVTYEVGSYEMSDGTQLFIDCRTYRLWEGAEE